jgi:hypothetical protein
MSADDKPRIEIKRGDADEWPPEIASRLVYLMEYAKKRDFSLLCGVGLHHERKRISAFFGPFSSANPDLAEMCDDIAEMFKLMARRLRQ